MKNIIIIFLFSLFFCSSTLGQTSITCITWEKLKSLGPNLRQIGLMDVKHSRDIKSSSWSVGCETLDRDQAKFSVYKDYVGELGVKHARLQSGWAKCEKEKGVYNFAWLDSCVNGLNEQGVRPWICLCYGNPVYHAEYVEVEDVGGGLVPLVNSEEAMAAWLKYVEELVTRYKDIVKEWEIWNEPYFEDMKQNYVYGPLLIRTAEIIKTVQPEAIILGEINGMPEYMGHDFSKELLEYLKSNNKLDLVNFWAYHAYRGNPDDSYQAIDELKLFLQSYNPKYKLYQGEDGCPSLLEWTHALCNYPWTEYSQAKWDLRRMAGDKVRDIPSSIFTIIDLQYPNMLQSFGLIRSNILHQFIYKRPSYYGVQHMASFFDDTVKPIGEMGYKSNSPRMMTVAGFKKGGSPILLIWYKDQIPSDDLKWNLVNLTIMGVNFIDPVYVEMITGKVFEIDKSHFKNKGVNARFNRLPVWDSPIMIVESSQVEFTANTK